MKKRKKDANAPDRARPDHRAIVHGAGAPDTDVIEAGRLMLKSRKLLELEHGQWLPWLKENFDLSESTARRYTSTAEYVGSKSAAVADFRNMAPGVLYDLAAGGLYGTRGSGNLGAGQSRHADRSRPGIGYPRTAHATANPS